MAAPTPQAARERILETAAGIFAEKGYKDATVREICEKADVNVAAVNYYFSSKERLYREVVKEMIRSAFDAFPVDEGLDAEDPPERRLRVFVHAILRRLLAPGGLYGWEGKGRLIARELSDPSPALDEVVRDFIRPTAAVLRDIVTRLLGMSAPSDLVERCMFSIIGQCFYYAYARPLISRLTTADISSHESIERLAGHIAFLSLRGMSGFAAGRAYGLDGSDLPGNAEEGRP